jgi:hypothetical protein
MATGAEESLNVIAVAENRAIERTQAVGALSMNK